VAPPLARLRRRVFKTILFGFGFRRVFNNELKMTDSQQLLADYVRNGSEDAFRELVTRYLALVYSTAIRLVGGDAYLAEDVAQTVFVDLARKAHGLPNDVMLGGWLHRDTCFVASKTMRSERRRQSRERHAVEMNSFQDHSESDLRRVAPILDEVINRLGAEDRAAILLRFFEQRDFRSVGDALGSTEDAARMRVTRALEKLHSLLKHRGVTLSVAALGTVLTAEAVTAAPIGLAVTISSVALGSAAAGTGTTLTLIKLIAMTKVQAGILCGIVVASAVTSWQVEHQAQAKMRQGDALLEQQRSQLAQLQAENERLSNLLTQAGSPNNPGNLQKLRDEVAILRHQTSELTVLQEEKRRLQVSLAKARQDLIGSTPGDLVFNKETGPKIDYMSDLGLAIRKYARNNHDQYPSSFEEAAAFFSDRVRNETNFTPAQFEIVYHGNQIDAFNDTYAHPKRLLLIREREPWRDTDGKWMKVYEAINGRRWTVSLPYDDFGAWEEQRIVPAEPSNE
jgi:RNA polymerase sigma factor (sigma-70 family)